MILIPELEIVLINPPRTASTALKKAILARYPKAMALYRHMEADGVPHGYDRWRRIGVVRDPGDRLFSLFRYCQTIEGSTSGTAAWRGRIAASVRDRLFSEWIIENDVIFTSAYPSEGGLGYWPGYACLHPLPENRKSQFLYLRPDLGTEIWRFDAIPALFQCLDLPELRDNASEGQFTLREVLNADAREYIATWFKWDMEVTR